MGTISIRKDYDVHCQVKPEEEADADVLEKEEEEEDEEEEGGRVWV